MNNQVLDIKLAITLAGNSRQVAEEIFAILLKTLPIEYENIKHAYISQDTAQLINYLHKLHGALNYCGVPKLKFTTIALETAAKKNDITELPALFIQFENAVNELLESATPNLFATHP